MKMFTLTAAALLLIGNFASAQAVHSGGRLAAMAVKIEFTSRGAGIDYQLKGDVMDLIHQDEADGKVALVEEKRWGREGEVTVCVQYNSPVDAYKADVEIGKMIETSKGLTFHERILFCDETLPLPSDTTGR